MVTFTPDFVRPGTVATYECEPGFELLGPSRRLCSTNGTWTPAGIPFCGKLVFESVSLLLSLCYSSSSSSSLTEQTNKQQRNSRYVFDCPAHGDYCCVSPFYVWSKSSFGRDDCTCARCVNGRCWWRPGGACWQIHLTCRATCRKQLLNNRVRAFSFSLLLKERKTGRNKKKENLWLRG